MAGNDITPHLPVVHETAAEPAHGNPIGAACAQRCSSTEKEVDAIPVQAEVAEQDGVQGADEL